MFKVNWIGVERQKDKYFRVSEWLFINTNSAIVQLHHGEEQFNFQWDDTEVRFVLDHCIYKLLFIRSCFLLSLMCNEYVIVESRETYIRQI